MMQKLFLKKGMPTETEVVLWRINDKMLKVIVSRWKDCVNVLFSFLYFGPLSIVF